MTRAELQAIVAAARCRVLGWQDAGNAGHRLALAAVIKAFDASESALLCEPSLARKTTRPPDIVLIDVEVGVHVFEVKGIALEQIESIEAGGRMRIRYANGTHRDVNPINQVRRAMFDIKDATQRAVGGAPRVPFKYWVLFPHVRRAEWIERFGDATFRPDEFLFANDLDPARLAQRLGASDRLNSSAPIHVCPLQELQGVWRAFGDTSVLYVDPQDRVPRRTRHGTLGEQFDDLAEAYKELSDEQKRLSETAFESGPRLIRGVAGSGKTVVLANNLSRRLERMLEQDEQRLFPDPSDRPPRLLAVCFNRALAPFIRKKIEIAYRQRTGDVLPQGTVDVLSFNSLMWKLARAGVWKYQHVSSADDMVRAIQYLDRLEQTRRLDPQRLQALAYDAIYVDEGQDFPEEWFRLLKELCRVGRSAEPSLFVFYDDAQNLFGRERPNWQSLGLNVRGGRSFVMSECFRNTRSIIEAGLNVLYGSCSAAPGDVPTRDFGDLGALEQKGLIRNDNGFWRVRFAKRDGPPPRVTWTGSRRQETELVIARLRWLIEQQQVRPQDILVLAAANERVEELADAAAAAAQIAGVRGIHFSKERKDQALGQPGLLSFSTVASAKGYDAYCVLLVSANEFGVDVRGRSSFYVGCTRAIELLEVFAHGSGGLGGELQSVLHRLAAN